MSVLILPGRGARGLRPSGPAVLNRDSAQAQGLVLWSPLAAPGSAVDVVNGRPATLTAGAWAAHPIAGGMRSHTANTDRVDTGFARHSDNFTFHFLARFLINDTGEWFGKWDGSGSGSTVRFRAGSAGLNTLEVRTSGGVNQSIDTSDNRLRLSGLNNDGRLWWITCTRADTGAVRIYIDGRLDNSGTLTSGALMSNATAWRAGLQFDGGHVGYQTDLRVYHRVLSDAEVWALYDPATRWDLYWVPGRVLHIDMAAAAAAGVRNGYYLPMMGVA